MSKGISLPMGIITSSYSTCEDSAVSVALKYSLMMILESEYKYNQKTEFTKIKTARFHFILHNYIKLICFYCKKNKTKRRELS